MNLKINNRLVYFIILLIVFIIYGNSVSNNYSLDDHLINSKNPLTQQGIKGLKNIFTHFSFDEKNSAHSYRPVLLTSFALEYFFLGTNPHISHLINILLYALFCMLLFRFLQLVFENISLLIKIITVLLFIVHPIHSELVDNIKSRDELLVAVFGLSTFIQFARYLSDGKIYRVGYILLFILLGFLSKETIILYLAGLPFLYFILQSAKGKVNWQKALYVLSTVLLSFFIVKYLKQNVSAESHARNYFFYENPMEGLDLVHRFPAGMAISMHYLKMLIWPFSLSYYYGYNQIPIAGWNNALPYAGILFFSLMAFLLIKTHKSNSFLFFAIALYVINVIAVSNIFKLMPGIVADRFIFLGSVSYCMILSYVLVLLFTKLKWINSYSGTMISFKPAILVLIVTLVFGVKVYSRNKAWASEFSLIKTDVETVPQSAKAHDLFAYQLLGKIRVEQDYAKRNAYIEEAVKQSEMCLEIYPEYITCINNLGTLYFAKQNFGKSELYFRKVLAIDSLDPNPYFNLGNVKQMTGKPDEAITYYEKALWINPNLTDLVPVYRQFILKNKRINGSLLFLERLKKKYPDNSNLVLLENDFNQFKNESPAGQKP